jgi:tetratricopeptide (TPR) repeat protein
MTRMARRTHVALMLMMATLASSACRSEKNAPAPSTQPATQATPLLQPVSLPDLSRMDPMVVAQITERYQFLQSLIGKTATPPGDLARAYGDMGNHLMAAEATAAAEPYYLHAESLAPDDARWPYFLGHVYMAAGDLPRATAAFERARRLQPDDVATLVWLGKLYLDSGKAESAEPLFRQALSDQPRLVAGLYGLGRAALARRDYPHAVEYLEQVLSADPRASAAHYQLALAYRELGDTTKAEAHLRQRGTVEIGPPDPLISEIRNLLRGAAAEEERGMRALENLRLFFQGKPLRDKVV